MHTHAGAIDRPDVAAASLCDRIHNPIPDPGCRPSAEAVIAGRAGAIALRQIAPGRAGSQDPEEDAVQDTPVINTRDATRLVGQKRLNDPPFKSP